MSDDTTDRWERRRQDQRGLRRRPIPKGTLPFYDVMLETIFGTVWDRPELSIRDRQLLVMGAIAAFGSTETWKVQARSALDRGELTPEQLRECLINSRRTPGIRTCRLHRPHRGDHRGVRGSERGRRHERCRHLQPVRRAARRPLRHVPPVARGGAGVLERGAAVLGARSL